MISQDFILSTPVLLAALTVLVILGYHYQRGLIYREYIQLHRIKRLLFPVLNRESRERGRALVHWKGYESPERIKDTPISPGEVGRHLISGGFSGHLIASLKARERPVGSTQYAHSQYVLTYQHEGEAYQTEVYLFRSEDGGTHIYCHVEPSGTKPIEHLSGEQYAGDKHGKFAGVWGSSKETGE